MTVDIAVEKRLHRSRRRLKEALNQQCSFYRDEENVFRCDRKREC